jgi:hypothetical protein
LGQKYWKNDAFSVDTRKRWNLSQQEKIIFKFGIFSHIGKKTLKNNPKNGIKIKLALLVRVMASVS